MSRVTVSLVGKVAGLTLIASLHAYWFLQPVPTTFKAVAAVLVVLSIVRPALGLVAFAALAPVSTVFADFSGGSGMGAQFLEQMALAIGAGVLVGRGASAGRTRIGGPALLVAVVALASAGSLLLSAAAFGLPLAPGLSERPLVHELWIRHAVQGSPTWAPLFAAITVAECALLGWSAERIVRQSPHLAIRLILVALMSHAGAALLDVNTLVGDARRTGDVFHALPEMLIGKRISMQTDVNAAASSLLLAAVAGFGLLTGSAVRRSGIGLLLALIAAGLWITGSRVAIVLAVVAVVVAIGWVAGRAGRRGRLMFAGAALLILGVVALLAWHYPASRYVPVSRSITGRLLMAEAGVQMFAAAPVFGIGITKFYGASANLVGPSLARLHGGQTHENAHNNFIQVLAEQGLVGLGALLWWLGVVFRSGGRAQAQSGEAYRGGLLLGIAACIGTWLTGHPLLVPEFAFVFWFYCGILAGTTPAPASTRTLWLPWVLVIGVLLSMPLRAQALRNDVDLEHIGLGLSQWQHDDQQRYREAGAAFSVFLPATGRPLNVPVRRAPGAPDPLILEARIRGRLIDTIVIGGEAWQNVLIVVQTGSRRFEQVDFAVRPQTAGNALPDVLLRVGRAAAR